MRPRLPPEPWLSRTAAPLRDRTYQADSLRPSRISMRISSCGIPTADSWISQRGACTVMLAKAKGSTPTTARTAEAAAPPAPPGGGAPPPADPGPRGHPARRSGGGDARRHEQQPADDVADAGD